MSNDTRSMAEIFEATPAASRRDLMTLILHSGAYDDTARREAMQWYMSSFNVTEAEVADCMWRHPQCAGESWTYFVARAAADKVDGA